MPMLGSIPPLLTITSSPPPVVYFNGDERCLSFPCVAIVGSRRPSGYGLRMAYWLGRELAKSGVCIVSGLARGIDGAAHAGALSGGGRTIAVLGHGLSTVYPREHRPLCEKIIKNQGLVVSEFPDKMPPLQRNFPRRNRIIAGLCWVTVIIEAHERSGSLITAGFAADEGRDVFVVPGRIFDSAYAGSYQLIREGARVFTQVQDILDALPEGARPTSTGARVNESAIHPELEKLFELNGGVAPLYAIRESPELVGALRSAMDNGDIVEFFPQEYVWVTGKTFQNAVAQSQSLPK